MKENSIFNSERTRYKELRRQVNYLVRKSKRLKRFLDPNLPAKKLWRNLDSVGRETRWTTTLFTPQISWTHFAYDSPTEEFTFINTFELEVYNSIHQIRSNAISADDVPIRFQKIILSHILRYVTHVFNTVLMSSSYPASWKFSKIMPVTKTNDPGSLSDYRPISILPALSKAMKMIMRNQITAHIERNGMMSLLQSGFRSNHSPPKNNKWSAFGFRGETYIYTRTAGLLESFRQCGSSAPLLETVMPVQILYQRCWPIYAAECNGFGKEVMHPRSCQSHQVSYMDQY
jgi:hypothetical protein